MNRNADFVRILLKEKMIDAATLDERIGRLDASKHPISVIRAWAQRRMTEAQA